MQASAHCGSHENRTHVSTSWLFGCPGDATLPTLRPLEIGRRLLRAIDDNVDIDIKGRRVSPDNFTIALSEPDRAALVDDESALLEELAAAATSYIRDEGLNVLTAVNVTFTTDASLDTGRLSITTAISGQQSDEEPVLAEPQVEVAPVPESEPASALATPEPRFEPAEVSELDVPPPAPADLPPPVVTPAPEPLVINDPPEPTPARSAFARSFNGTAPATRQKLGAEVGRSTDNDIQIADGQASRHHAEIRYDNGRHHIVDLNSTNGTLVNDNRIASAHALSHGDIITIGNTELRYESS